ncbi:MAG: phosphoglycerate dehydrogenase [Rhodothermales bacterium]
MKVLITDAVDQVCIDMLEDNGIEADVQLKKSPDELLKLAAGADGWIIRSGTTITSELLDAADNLKVVGRAGVGVDNIDLDAATRRGVLVINAPDGNTISTAEHSCAMLLSLARRIPQANRSLVDGRWDRKVFTGSEVYKKTLGVVGVGKIGREVAERMAGFGMKVIGYDPVVSSETAERFGVRLVELDELFAASDFITVHTPLNDATRGMLRAETLATCKTGVRIVNCARGGIVDEADLLEALESGQVGGAALDVYSQEPPPASLEKLIRHPNVVATPHIAASTDEAQEKVATQITEQVINALNGEPVQTPVNAMAIKMAAQPEAQPYLQLADRLGQIVAQIGDGSVRSITVRCRGDVARRFSEVISIAAVRGVLSHWISEPVNLINAPLLAEEMGVNVTEEREAASGGYTNLIEIDLAVGDERRVVAGTIFDRDELRLVRMDDYWLELRPEGRLLFYRNVDRPGMLASVGSILARNDINIGALALGRAEKGSVALTAVSVDEEVSDEVAKEIAGLDGVEQVRRVQL